MKIIKILKGVKNLLKQKDSSKITTIINKIFTISKALYVNSLIILEKNILMNNKKLK